MTRTRNSQRESNAHLRPVTIAKQNEFRDLVRVGVKMKAMRLRKKSVFEIQDIHGDKDSSSHRFRSGASVSLATTWQV